MKIGKAFIVLSSVFCVATAASAFAEEAPFATFHIQLENNQAQSMVNPVITSPVTKGQVAFRILNNTGKQAYFVDNQDNRYIPMVSENTVTIPYVEGEQYKVVDQDGKTIATWQLQNAQSSMQIASSSETKAKYEDWSQRIQKVIQSNQVVATSTYQQSTQDAQTHSSEQTEGTTVRGFW
jgi:hypothetical protein